ncbi:hypothetical protein GUJ93_ZPchr0010g7669 [Zizania palustris]|uniref:Uncharacterized protein n=1 Tax=Zizania palustris TaxID=103762 RepID=A0A8J6BA48_ZIZPA|nr:hypothetical protein GUJ93_ZPchr0010g7669 [Zizania palustris]
MHKFARSTRKKASPIRPWRGRGKHEPPRLLWGGLQLCGSKSQLSTRKQEPGRQPPTQQPPPHRALLFFLLLISSLPSPLPLRGCAVPFCICAVLSTRLASPRLALPRLRFESEVQL